MRFNVAAYRVALKKAQELLEAQDSAGEIDFTDPNGNILSQTVGAALAEVGLNIKNYHLSGPTGNRPATEDELYESLFYFDTTLDTPLWCAVPGRQEVNTLTVNGAPTKLGLNDITIGLHGVPVTVEVDGGALDVHNATITEGAVTASGDITFKLDDVDTAVAVVHGTLDVHDATITAPATSDGDVTVTLNGVDNVVAVLNLDDEAAVAGKIAAGYAADTDWDVVNVGAVLTFTAKAREVKAGAFSFDGGTTGVTCTGGITQSVVGVADDTAADVAGKVTIAYGADPDWTVTNLDTVITFEAKAPGEKLGVFEFDDTDTTGVTCTAGVTETTPGVDSDSINDTAEKIRDETYTGWTTGGTGAVVTFTKDTVGAGNAAGFDDTDLTGVTLAGGAITRLTAGSDTVWSTIPNMNDNLILPEASIPQTEEGLFEGLKIYDTTNNRPLWCKVPGECEVDTLEVKSQAAVMGDLEITLDGTVVATDVLVDIPATYQILLDTGATETGDITVTLGGVDYTVSVTAEDVPSAVANAIQLAFVEDTDWLVIADGPMVSFNALVSGPKTGTFTFDGGTTGVSSVLGVTQMVAGALADTIEQIATKIRENTYPGWTTGGTGAFVVFTKDTVGSCMAPSFDTSDTGVSADFIRTSMGVSTVWETLPVLELPELTYVDINEETNEFLCDLGGQRETKFSMTFTNEGNKAVSFTNWPISGRCEVFLEVTAQVVPTVAWNLTGGTVRWAGGSAPALEAGKTYRIEIYSKDGMTWDAYAKPGI